MLPTTLGLPASSSARLVALLLHGAVVVAQCVPAPVSASPIPGIVGAVAAATNWDPDGLGPAPEVVALVGNVTAAGAVGVANALAYDPVARTFAALGTSLPASAVCVAAGPTGELFAGTSAGGVFAWNGSDWQLLGSGVGGGVRALRVRSNGDLVAAGAFTAIGGVAAPLARWDGVAWSSLGTVTRTGGAAVVTAIDEGPNGALVVAGQFDAIAGVAMTGLGRLDVAWTALGIFAGSTPELAVFDTSGGLVVSGYFTSVNGVGVGPAARWDGVAWSDFSVGLPTWPSALVRSNGSLLAVLGVTVGTFNGLQWVPLPAPGAMAARAVAKAANGDLLAFGASLLGGAEAGARWQLGTWAPLGDGTNGVARAVAALPDGSWAIGGDFGVIGAVPTAGLALRSAAGYVDIADAQVHHARRLLALGGSSGGALAALSVTGDVAAWNGTAWAPLGGMSWPPGYGIASLDAAPGGAVLGKNDTPASPGAELWTFDGVAWLVEALPGSIAGQSRYIHAVAVLPNGERAVAGNAVVLPSTHLAMFDGVNLVPIPGGPNASVLTARVRRNGELVVGGAFSAPFPGIARWNGSTWLPCGSGVSGPVNAIEELPNGDLLVAGSFATAGGVLAPNLARWDGASWSAFAPGPAGPVYALGMAANGEVAVGGAFLAVGGLASARIGFYPPACPAIAVAYGAGCAGAAGSVALAAAALPWLGSTYRATASGFAPNSLVIAVRGLMPAALPLNTVLPPAGPGCTLLASPDLLDLYVAPASVLDVSFPIPAVAALLAQSLRQQVVPLQLAANGAFVGLQSSNALLLTIGAL